MKYTFTYVKTLKMITCQVLLSSYYILIFKGVLWENMSVHSWPWPYNCVLKGLCRYRLIGLVKFARNKNCSSDKINNNRDGWNTAVDIVIHWKSFFFCALLHVGVVILPIGRRTVSKQRLSIILAKNSSLETASLSVFEYKSVI